MIRTDEVTFAAADGWVLAGLIDHPDRAATSPGVVAVPGSRHERDAWTSTCRALANRGVASLRFDIRGRGTSAGAVRHADMGPQERRRVGLDVAAALDALAGQDGIDGDRLAVLAEQDTAALAVEAAAGDQRVRALALLSARSSARASAALADRSLPVLGMVSTEDREGLRATVDAYLAGAADGSHLDVFDGLGIGITMASVLQFEQPEAEPLEDRIAGWLAARLV